MNFSTQEPIFENGIVKKTAIKQLEACSHALQQHQKTLLDVISKLQSENEQHHQQICQLRSQIEQLQFTERLNQLELASRSKLEQGLIGRKDALVAIIESIGEGVLVCDQEGNFLQYNSSMESIFGRMVLDFDQENWSEVYGIYYADGKKIYPTDKLPIVRAIRGYYTEEVELFVRNEYKPDGVFINASGRPLEETHHLKGGIMICRDVTHKIVAKKILEYKNKELSRLLSQLGELNYAIAHDLKEPVRSVVGFSQLLQTRYNQYLDQDALEYISLILQSGQQMASLVEGLFEYAQVDARIRFFHHIDVGQLIKRATKNLNQQIQKRQAIIECYNLPSINGERLLMVQLFEQLIHNALKFNKNRPVIVISVEKQEKHWLFSIKDNGMGIEEEYQDKIFNIFQHLHADQSLRGSGIGLSICKKIVSIHKGTIWVESKTGEGATFYFTIPFVQ